MKHESNFVPAMTDLTWNLPAPVTFQASGSDIARQLLAMREAARAAGLSKVVLCLDYAYYEALEAGSALDECGAEAI